MKTENYIKLTNKNNRLLLRCLKEYHLQYNFIDELIKQRKIFNMMSYFEEYMGSKTIFETLTNGENSIVFARINDNHIRFLFRELLYDINDKFRSLIEKLN